VDREKRLEENIDVWEVREGALSQSVFEWLQSGRPGFDFWQQRFSSLLQRTHRIWSPPIYSEGMLNGLYCTVICLENNPEFSLKFIEGAKTLAWWRNLLFDYF
jgi:hypothetical protein